MRLLKTIFPKNIYDVRLRALLAVGALVIVAVLLSLPTFSASEFEKRTVKELAGAPWVKVVKTERRRELIEPISWFRPPVSVFHLIMPEAPKVEAFRYVRREFQKPDVVWLVEPECEDKKYYYSYPVGETYLYFLNEEQNFDVVIMSDAEYQAYCEYDWTAEEALVAQKQLTGEALFGKNPQ